MTPRPVPRVLLGHLGRVFVAMSATAVALAAFDAFFADPSWRRPVALAAVVGCLAAAMLVVTRCPAPLCLAVGLVGLVLVAAWVLPSSTWHGVPTARGLSHAAQAVLHGWARDLTVGVPAHPAPDLVALPVALGWSTALLATSAALRSRSPLLPLAAPLATFLVALMLTRSHAPYRLGLTALFATACVILALLQAGRPDPSTTVSAVTAAPHATAGMTAAESAPPDRRHRLLTSGVVGVPLALAVCAVAVTGAAANPVVRGDHRYDPRSKAPPATTVVSDLNPLLGLKSQLVKRPPAPLFTVRALDGLPLPDLVRVAALDDFDGVTWTAREQFSRPAARIAPPAPVSRPTVRHLEFVLGGLTGPWLPVAGQPTQVAGADVAMATASGNLIHSGAAAGAGYRYQVTTLTGPTDVVADPTIADSLPGGPGQLPADLQLPSGLPHLIQKVADETTRAQSTAFGKLLALEQQLRKEIGYSTAVPPGESYAAISLMLAGKPPFTAAFAEQRTSAFAVLARAEGFPTRVVVGYRVPRTTPRVTSAVITTADAHAWPEVLLSGFGWVPFAPTDVTARVATPQDLGAVTVTSNVDRGAAQGGLDPGLATRSPWTQHAGRALLPWLSALVALVVASCVVTLVAKRRRRRRRLRAGSSRQRLAGAWAEMLDRLRESGHQQPGSATAGEVADRLRLRLGDEQGAKVAAPVDAVAELVAVALCAPRPPEEDQVRRAWELEGRLTRALDDAHGRVWRFPLRLRRLLDPRSLRHRREPGWGLG